MLTRAGTGSLCGMAHEFHMPDLGEGLTEAEIVKWLVSVGDTVEIDQVLVEIETAKTVVEIPSPYAGVITRINAAEGDTVDVGAVLFVIDGDPDEGSADVPSESAPGAATETTGDGTETTAGGTDPASPTEGDRARAMPIVRKLAKEKGVDLSTVVGTGPHGAVTRADVESAAVEGSSSQSVPMSLMRRTIARNMAESWRTIPHVTVQAELRAERLVEARSIRGTSPYPIEVLVAVTVLPLLERYPEFNSSVRGDSVLHSGRYDLGFAVDTEVGLMVVVVKNADQLSLIDLTEEFERLAEAARNRSITLDEVTGQTFTISNIGALGGGHGTPIIPLGTSSILSIGRAQEQPIVENGELAAALVAPIDLSYDHRLIDGALGQRFLSDLVTALESQPSDVWR